MPKSKTFKPRVILPEMKPLPYDLMRKRENQEALALIREMKKRKLFYY